MLDVSDALEDVLLQDSFVVQRRQFATSGTGIAGAPSIVSFNAVGVVYGAGANDLDRRADAQLQNKTIVILTKFALRYVGVDSTGTQFQPDIVVWNGNSYLVSKDVEDYSKYGQGYIKATCTLNDMQAVAASTQYGGTQQ